MNGNEGAGDGVWEQNRREVGEGTGKEVGGETD